MASKQLLIIGIALLLTVPVGAATWFSGKGSYEPDTIHDQQDGTMFATADTSADALQVYFNVYQEQYVTTLNPNSEILGSRIMSTGAMTHHAYLGVWKDCNDDGYIGAVNGALHVYPSALNAVCADGTVFNRGGWVYEFQWIGPGQMQGGFDYWPARDDQRWVNDTESLIWGDLGLPGAAGGGGGTCTISPLPSGTTAGTGNLINYVDCWVTQRAVANAINDVDGQLGLGVGFEDPSNPHRSSSPLNQDLPVNLWGNPYSGEDNDEWQTGLVEKDSQKGRDPSYDPNTDYDPDDTDKAFHVWDCSQPAAITLDNPTGSEEVSVEDPSGGLVEEDGTIEQRLSRDGVVLAIAAPAPGIDNPTGSYYDAVNETERGANNPTSGGYALSDADNCNPNNTTASSNYPSGLPESSGDSGTDNAPGKKDHTFFFQFTTGLAPVTAFGLRGNILLTDSDREAIEEATGVAPPHEGDLANATLGEGYEVSPDVAGFLPTRPDWIGLPNLVNFGVTVRDPLTDPTTPANAFYTTFYARIGAATTGLGATTAANNAARVYGFEWCQGATSGVVNGFDCDADHWWMSGSGSDMPTLNGFETGARVGYSYHLRDFDCYDNTLLRGSGVEASLVDLTAGGACRDAVG